MNKLLKLLRDNQPVFLDTSCFIYLLEDHPKYVDILNIIFDKISVGELHSSSSIISLSELIVKPLREKDTKLVSEYQDFLTQLPNFKLENLDYETAIEAAEIKANYNFELIDSFQLSLAERSGCKSFLTNDLNLKKFNKLKVICFADFT